MGELFFDQVSVGDHVPELAVDVTPTTVVLGALASRDWRPMHHDYKFATERNGVADIFLNTPNQAAWIERFVTDWTGPLGRIGRMKFRMRDSVFPGARMTFRAEVTETSTDEAGCSWADLEVALVVADLPESQVGGGAGNDDPPADALGEERVATTCTIRVAIPADKNDNPWARKGDNWKP